MGRAGLGCFFARPGAAMQYFDPGAAMQYFEPGAAMQYFECTFPCCRCITQSYAAQTVDTHTCTYTAICQHTCMYIQPYVTIV